LSEKCGVTVNDDMYAMFESFF